MTMGNKIKFRLPTRKEFENLNKYSTRWNEEKKGLEISNDKGDILFLPALGYRYGTEYYEVGSQGYYWSSTANEFYCGYAHAFYFESCGKYVGVHDGVHELPVRLVSDEPFEGSIEFDGIYWKQENEVDYYRYDVIRII